MKRLGQRSREDAQEVLLEVVDGDGRILGVCPESFQGQLMSLAIDRRQRQDNRSANGGPFPPVLGTIGILFGEHGQVGGGMSIVEYECDTMEKCH